MAVTDTERFMSVLYEKAGDGFIGVSYLRGKGDAPITRWFSKDQVQEMAEYAMECGRKYNTCLNINLRATALDNYHRGLSRDVSEVVAFIGDYDIRGPAHAQTKLPESRCVAYNKNT